MTNPSVCLLAQNTLALFEGWFPREFEPLSVNDPDIRAALIGYLSRTLPNPRQSLLVEELNVCEGRSRMDMVLVTDTLHGFEIKSRVDSLSRLAGQLEDYRAVFDRLTVVIGVNHLTGILSGVPSWCGIILASRSLGRVTLEPFRESRPNLHLDRLALAQLLWRNEALEVLTRAGAVKGVKSKTRPVIWSRLAETLSAEALNREVCQAFRKRPKKWRPNLLP